MNNQWYSGYIIITLRRFVVASNRIQCVVLFESVMYGNQLYKFCINYNCILVSMNDTKHMRCLYLFV